MSLVMPTRILVVGGGGREHALAWKLAAEPGVNEVVVAPGSAGIAEEPRVPVAPDVAASSIGAVVDLARARATELVVVGPEAPLADGLADALIEAGIPVFGATRAAAEIEWSKAFCHEVAAAAGVRMAASAEVCTTRAEADRAVARLAAAGSGIVIKEDGLAAGKGVTVLDPGADATGAAGRAVSDGATDRASSSRSGCTGPRRASSPCATASARSPCRRRATTSGSATAIAARTPAGWVPTRHSPI